VSETTHAAIAAPRPRTRPAALGFIYAAVMMNTISMGVIIPVFPVLVKSLTGQGDAGAAQIMGVFGAVWALMNLVFAPIFGNLSDRYGRRPVLLVANKTEGPSARSAVAAWSGRTPSFPAAKFRCTPKKSRVNTRLTVCDPRPRTSPGKSLTPPRRQPWHITIRA